MFQSASIQFYCICLELINPELSCLNSDSNIENENINSSCPDNQIFYMNKFTDDLPNHINMYLEKTEEMRKTMQHIRLLYTSNSQASDFAMEIEFKVTKDGKISIKQARPWVR